MRNRGENGPCKFPWSSSHSKIAAAAIHRTAIFFAVVICKLSCAFSASKAKPCAKVHSLILYSSPLSRQAARHLLLTTYDLSITYCPFFVNIEFLILYIGFYWVHRNHLFDSSSLWAILLLFSKCETDLRMGIVSGTLENCHPDGLGCLIVTMLLKHTEHPGIYTTLQAAILSVSDIVWTPFRF